MNTEVSAMLIQ